MCLPFCNLPTWQRKKVLHVGIGLESWGRPPSRLRFFPLSKESVSFFRVLSSKLSENGFLLSPTPLCHFLPLRNHINRKSRAIETILCASTFGYAARLLVLAFAVSKFTDRLNPLLVLGLRRAAILAVWLQVWVLFWHVNDPLWGPYLQWFKDVFCVFIHLVTHEHTVF